MLECPTAVSSNFNTFADFNSPRDTSSTECTRNTARHAANDRSKLTQMTVNPVAQRSALFPKRES